MNKITDIQKAALKNLRETKHQQIPLYFRRKLNSHFGYCALGIILEAIIKEDKSLRWSEENRLEFIILRGKKRIEGWKLLEDKGFSEKLTRLIYKLNDNDLEKHDFSEIANRAEEFILKESN